MGLVVLGVSLGCNGDRNAAQIGGQSSSPGEQDSLDNENRDSRSPGTGSTQSTSPPEQKGPKTKHRSENQADGLAITGWGGLSWGDSVAAVKAKYPHAKEYQARGDQRDTSLSLEGTEAAIPGVFVRGIHLSFDPQGLSKIQISSIATDNTVWDAVVRKYGKAHKTVSQPAGMDTEEFYLWHDKEGNRFQLRVFPRSKSIYFEYFSVRAARADRNVEEAMQAQSERGL